MELQPAPLPCEGTSQPWRGASDDTPWAECGIPGSLFAVRRPLAGCLQCLQCTAHIHHEAMPLPQLVSSWALAWQRGFSCVVARSLRRQSCCRRHRFGGRRGGSTRSLPPPPPPPKRSMGPQPGRSTQQGHSKDVKHVGLSTFASQVTASLGGEGGNKVSKIMGKNVSELCTRACTNGSNPSVM